MPEPLVPGNTNTSLQHGADSKTRIGRCSGMAKPVVSTNATIRVNLVKIRQHRNNRLLTSTLHHSVYYEDTTNARQRPYCTRHSSSPETLPLCLFKTKPSIAPDDKSHSLPRQDYPSPFLLRHLHRVPVVLMSQLDLALRAIKHI
jgi:hypothetical protein